MGVASRGASTGKTTFPVPGRIVENATCFDGRRGEQRGVDEDFRFVLTRNEETTMTVVNYKRSTSVV